MQIKSRVLIERVVNLATGTGHSGMTIGMHVDKQLDDMVRDGEACHDITLSFGKDEWQEFVDLMHRDFKVV